MRPAQNRRQTRLCIVTAMPAWSTLLRVLLCLSLILDGTASAVAATQMQLAPIAQAQAIEMDSASSGSTLSKATPPCHAQMAMMSEHAAPVAMAGLDHSSPSKHPLPDCCKAGHCSCACAHQIQTALALMMMDAIPGHDRAATAMTSGHPAPS